MNILELSREGLSKWFEGFGEKPFRTNQIIRWIWEKSVLDPEKMTDLPENLRKIMKENFSKGPYVEKTAVSRDRSVKLLVRLEDGNAIESVLMRTAGHVTICVSTQVGCPLSCTFCQSGSTGLERNLEASEIIYQVALARPKPRNIVFMGVGEPMLNWANFKESVLRLQDEAGMSQRHMTVSTVGIPGMITRLAQELPRVNLAISLHAPTQRLRERIMPKAAKVMQIRKLIEEIKLYQGMTGNRVTFEYVMLDGVNDGLDNADALTDITDGMASLINLIPYNPTDCASYRPSNPAKIRFFLERLRSQWRDATVRKSLGLGVDSACGQLRARRSDDE